MPAPPWGCPDHRSIARRRAVPLSLDPKARPSRILTPARSAGRLTFHSPSGSTVSQLDGPCDPGSRCALHPSGRPGFPGSHGPHEERANEPKVNFGLIILMPDTAPERRSVVAPLPRVRARQSFVGQAQAMMAGAKPSGSKH
jgi:hypothetical protein